MKAHGWCPSDIARSEAKFKSIQSLNIIQMMDKSLPSRNHNHCTELICKLYQIDMSKYHVSHQQESSCQCKQLEVDGTLLTKILEKDGRVPLLRLKENLQNLEAELVESTDSTPYIAISHVWANGLGNPFAKSLHR
jgi:hypothetical protein